MRDPLGSVMYSKPLSIYRAAVLAPIALGIIVWAILSIFGDVTWVNDLFGNLGLYVVVAWAIAGVPYLILAFGFLFWSRAQNGPQARRVLLFGPLALAVLSVMWWTGYVLLHHGPEDRPLDWGSMLLLSLRNSAIILGVGYLYISLIFLGAGRLHHGDHDAA